MKSMHTILLVVTSFFLAQSNLFAELDTDHDHHETHSVHAHGVAELTLAWDGEILEIELESPAANVVGFEYKATTAEEKNTVQKSESLLKDVAKIITIKNASCRSSSVSIDMAGVLTEGKHDKGHHDKDHHEKEHHEYKQESKEHHESHEHHHEGKHDKKQETHSEITANYQFECSKPKDSISVSLGLFDHFRGFEKINAMWVTNTEQGAKTLDAENKSLVLR